MNNIENKTDFQRVLATLKNNKIMVKTMDDGIYIRLAGNEDRGEAFSETFVNIYPIKPPTNFHIEENLEQIENKNIFNAEKYLK